MPGKRRCNSKSKSYPELRFSYEYESKQVRSQAAPCSSRDGEREEGGRRNGGERGSEKGSRGKKAKRKTVGEETRFSLAGEEEGGGGGERNLRTPYSDCF